MNNNLGKQFFVSTVQRTYQKWQKFTNFYPFKASTLLLYITQNCNLRCNHCNYLLTNPNHFSTNTDISLEFLDDILDRTMPHFKNITISAEGEPTVHKHFIEILQKCADTGARIDIGSNGIASVKNLEAMVKYIDGLMISLDGIDAASYHRMRGGKEKTFEKVLDTIHKVKCLMERTPDARLKQLSLNFIIERNSLKLMEQMIHFCEDLGVDVLLNNFVQTGDSTGKGWGPLIATDPEVIEEYNRLTSITDWKVNVNLPRLVGGEWSNYCHFLFGRLPVNYKGYLSPCCYIPTDEKYGNVMDASKPWDTEPLKQFREKFVKASVMQDLPEVCRYCHIRTTKRYDFDCKTKTWIER